MNGEKSCVAEMFQISVTKKVEAKNWKWAVGVLFGFLRFQEITITGTVNFLRISFTDFVRWSLWRFFMARRCLKKSLRACGAFTNNLGTNSDFLSFRPPPTLQSPFSFIYLADLTSSTPLFFPLQRWITPSKSMLEAQAWVETWKLTFTSASLLYSPT